MIANKSYAKPIQHKRYARNGQFPDASFLGQCVARQNHAMAYRRKVFASLSNFGAVGILATTTVHRFRCHVGYGATHLGFVLGIGRDYRSNGLDPVVQIKCTIAGGGDTSVDLHVGSNVTVETDAPSEISWRYPRVAVTANTTYEVSIVVSNYARVLSLCAFEIASDEVDGTVDYYVPIQGGVAQPVYDSLREDQLVGLSNMWRRNGTHLFSWLGDGSGTGTDFTTTTWTNLFDGSTTSTNATPGIRLRAVETANLQNKCRISDGSNLDVVLAVYASCTVAAVGEVRLFDTDAATSRCSITAVGTGAAWYTSATTLTSIDVLSKLDVQCRVSATPRTFTVHAISAYCYLA